MIGVLGAGAFGTALAVVQAVYGRPVRLWARRDAAALQTGRRTPRLEGVDVPPAVAVTGDLSALDDCGTLLLALPMQALRGFLADHAAQLDGRVLVACCKGIDLTTLTGPTALIAAACPRATPMILTGPSFAADIARQLSTALTLAGRDAAAVRAAQAAIAVPSLRIYANSDVTGAEMGGALKNVIAIACGAAMGEGMGESARAALMTRGFAEITRLSLACGARRETLMGLSGFGDLVLTCTSGQSRNYRYGLALGRGEPFDPGVTVEGVATARATLALAARLGVEMPITAALVELVDNDISVAEAIQSLLSRPLREE
ncbi:MAG: NAD(P)-dependent glycerol-3-phosphate dehydrogenase [Paracoccaceae bacterium]|nr:MAG: NAD(P)-dependent glycerol-3-phosphate dehydrogenase [Paracoccaceae bacterium]